MFRWGDTKFVIIYQRGNFNESSAEFKKTKAQRFVLTWWNWDRCVYCITYVLTYIMPCPPSMLRHKRRLYQTSYGESIVYLTVLIQTLELVELSQLYLLKSPLLYLAAKLYVLEYLLLYIYSNDDLY